MTTTTYDAIVVGARCAGAPTAMLLARQGLRVLMVDRASLPSDTVSTHLVHAPGVAALSRWGLLDAVAATGCPPIDQYSFDFGGFSLRGSPHPVDGLATAYSPRRHLLDMILVEAAAAAGVDVRPRCTVDEVLIGDDGAVTGIRGRTDGHAVLERARVVVVADGRNSALARRLSPEVHHARPLGQWGTYAYWSGLPVDGFETTVRPQRGWAAMPTNDGLTLLVVGWPADEAVAYRADVEANYLATLELEPRWAERVRAAKRESRFAGGMVANGYRVPYGPGWVLVGDAGVSKDSITAQGISDAFRDAELCATAVHEALDGRATYDEAMARYHHERDVRSLPMYELTCQLGTLAPPPPEVAAVLAACAGDQMAMDAFVSMVAGTMSPLEFFDPAHVEALLAAAA